jgi:hypothetical protein
MSFTSPFPPAHSFVPGPPVINVHSVTDDNTRVVRSASRCSHRRSKPTRGCGCGRGYVSGVPSHTHMHDANALGGLPLCSALVRMQLVQRMRLLQLVIVLAFLVTKNKKQRACVCHCAGGRGPRNRYRDTRLRHLRILGYCSPCVLSYGSATGLVLLCVLLCTLCVAFHLRTVIALRLVLVLFLFLYFCSPQILRL